jgi:molybdate transport system substrate-binding protein
MKLYETVATGIALLLVTMTPGPSGGIEQRKARRDLLIAAAASLSGIAPELTRAFHDDSGIDLRFNFAASNTLARQIVEGARVDVFISADVVQMDAAERAGRVVAGTRADIVSNQLVLIVNRLLSAEMRADDLASASVRRIAMGDPEGVPAGVYGRQWLESVRLWGAVHPKVVPLPSSPSVVAAISEGRADVGIVYLSDVVTRGDGGGVRVALRVPVEDAPQIVYPAAAITGGQIPLARQFIGFLRRARAQQIFVAAGFRAIGTR